MTPFMNSGNGWFLSPSLRSPPTLGQGFFGRAFRVASSLHDQRGSAGWRPAKASTCDVGDEIAIGHRAEALSPTIGGQQEKLPKTTSNVVDRNLRRPGCRLDCAVLGSRIADDKPSTTAHSHDTVYALQKPPRRRLLNPQRIEGCTRFSLGLAEPPQGAEHSLASKLQEFVRRSHDDPIYEN